MLCLIFKNKKRKRKIKKKQENLLKKHLQRANIFLNKLFIVVVCNLLQV